MRWDITAGKGERGKRSVMQCANAAAQCTNKQNITKQRSNTRWRSRRRRMLTAPQHDGTRRPCQPPRWSANLLFANVFLLREHHGRENGENDTKERMLLLLLLVVVVVGVVTSVDAVVLLCFLERRYRCEFAPRGYKDRESTKYMSGQASLAFFFKDKSKNNLSARSRPF